MAAAMMAQMQMGQPVMMAPAPGPAPMMAPQPMMVAQPMMAPGVGAQMAAGMAAAAAGMVDAFFGNRVLMKWDPYGNKIAVQTERPFYYGGEVVQGNISVFIAVPVVCRGVMLKVTGFEHAKWTEQQSKWVEVRGSDPPERRVEYYMEDHEGRREFFKQRMLVSGSMDMLPPGRYTYPFSYKLPDGLPGVFFEERKIPVADGKHEHIHAKIIYKLKAHLDFAGCKDLKACQMLTIHERLAEGMRPAFGEQTAEVMFLCCIPKGKCNLKAWFDKNAYHPGERADIKAEITNDSTSPFNHMVVKLMRFITLRDRTGHEKRLVDTVLQTNYPGVKPHEHTTRDLPLDFKGDFQPSTAGQICKCMYRFDVECDIPYAPDIEVHMPVQLYATPPTVWGVPPAW